MEYADVNGSPRNDIAAKVTAIQRRGVIGQVDVMLEGTSNKMSSVMTLELVDALSLAVGDTVYASPRR